MGTDEIDAMLPCTKIVKPLMVYIFSKVMLCTCSNGHNDDADLWQKLNCKCHMII